MTVTQLAGILLKQMHMCKLCKAKRFLVETASRLSTGKDPLLATDQNRHREGFFLHAWRDLVNKIASEYANDKSRKNVICPKY